MGHSRDGQHGHDDLGDRVAASMIRDVSNVLAAILTQVDLAQGSLEIQDVVGLDRDLEDIRASALRGTTMVGQILAFGDRAALRVTSVPLQEIVAGAVRLARPLLRPTVRLRLVEGAGPAIRADAGAVEQMLIGLVLGAGEAMPGGGEVTIRTGDTRLTRADVARRGWGRPGRFGVLSVSDTGSGFSPDSLEEAFQLRTPAPGAAPDRDRDLLIVYGLMKQHRGFVELRSHPDGGTEIRLLFRPAPRTSVPAGHETTHASSTSGTDD